MAEIENLSISISTNTANAVSGVGKLASALERLRNIAQGSSSGARQTGEQIGRVGEAGRTAAQKIEQLSRSAQGLGKMKLSGNVFQQMKQLQQFIGETQRRLEALRGIRMSDMSVSPVLTGQMEHTQRQIDSVMAKLERMRMIQGDAQGLLSEFNNPKAMLVAHAQGPEAYQDWKNTIRNAKEESVYASKEIEKLNIQLDRLNAKMGGLDARRTGEMERGFQRVQDEVGRTEQSLGGLNAQMAALKRQAVIGTLTAPFRALGAAAGWAAGGVVRLVRSMARITFYRAIRAIIKDIGQGFKDLYGYSKENGTQFARSMDTMVTATRYLRNSIVAMVSPIVNALAPAFDYLVDRVVEALNWINQLISALSGADTYTVAKKVAVTWEDTFDSAGNSASNANDKIKELKRTILSFDEINKLNGQNASGSSGGSGSGSSPYTNGYQTMFETRKLENKFKGFGDAIHKAFEDTFSRLGLLFEGAKLVLGAILLFTGANIPLGLGLIASGAIGMANIIAEKWDGLDPKIKNTLKVLHGVVVVAELVLGAILLFTGANIPLGLGLLALGAGGLAEAIAPHWDDIVKKIKEICSNIKKAVSDWWQNTKSWFENTGENIWTAIQDGIVKPIKNTGEWLKENVADPFVNKVKELFGIASPSTVMKGIGGFLIDGLLNGILAGMVGIAAWIAKNIIQPIVDAFSKDDSDKEGKDFGDRLWDSIKKSWKREARDLNVTVSSSTKAQDLWDAFLLEWKGLKSNTAYFALRIANKAETLWDAFKKEWNNLTLSVYFLIKTASSANGHWDVFKKAWVGGDRKVGFIITTASSANGHWDVFKKAWDGGDRKVGFIITTASSANGHWDVFKKAWDGGNRKVGFIITTASSANGHWDVFKKAWDGGDRKVGFIITTASSANGHWDVFKKAWDGGDRKVGFIITTASSANGHWDVFKKAWDGGDRKVGFIITTASSANGHWTTFKKAWDGGDRKVGFIITTASSANGHWDVFKKAWDGGDRKVGFIITTASSANGHWDVFKKAWDGENRKVGFIITTASTANGHWNTFKKAWDALETKTVNMTIARSNTAKSLWDALVKDWNAAISGKSLTAKVTLGIEKDSSWNSTAGDLVHETFGGSSRDSSTPGGTRGGGSGRFSLGALTASVKLEPDGWSSVSDWITRNKYNNDASSVNVNLNRDTNKWWSLAEWIIRNKYNNDASSVNVDLNRDTNKWWSLADWITRNKYNNDASSVDVNLNRDTNKWWSLSDWITRNKYNNDASSVNVNLNRDTNKWWSLADWITRNKYNVDSVFQAVDLAKDGWNTVSSYVSNNMGNTVYQSVKLNIDWDDYYTNLETGTRGNPYFYHAKGGVETPHGGWSFAQGGYINYYARGTNNAHGTMFVAGEAGPEIVGHIGGRTEILNRSQLASTMFSAVRSAMTGVEIAANFYSGDSAGISAEDMAALMELVKAGSEAVKGQNALLKEQNAYLREIKDKEMVTEVTTTGINRAQAKANRRAGIVVG